MAKSDQVQIQVWLVPSGSTAWDDAGRLQGGTDLPLSEAGRDTLAEKTEPLAGLSLGVVLCGPDEASVETAKAIASATGAKVRRIKGLAEIDMGLWQGLLDSELRERYQKSYGQWRENLSSVTAPDGESAPAAKDRLLVALSKALEKADTKPETAVVLRPIARGILRCCLMDQSLENAGLPKKPPAAEQLKVTRGQLEAARVAAHASV